MIPGPTRRSQLVARGVLAAVIGGLVLCMCAAPKAAETGGGRPYEIWALRASGKDLRTDAPNWVRLEGSEVYASKVECQTAIRSVRLDRKIQGASGWRLTCQPVQ